MTPDMLQPNPRFLWSIRGRLVLLLTEWKGPRAMFSRLVEWISLIYETVHGFELRTLRKAPLIFP